MFRSSILLGIFSSVLVAAETPPLVNLESVSPVQLKSGSPAQASVSFKVKEGFHVQSNPATEKYLIPTELKWEKLEGVEVSKIIYPNCDAKLEKAIGACKPHKLKGSDKAISTYEGVFKIDFSVHAPKELPAGKKELKGKLRYQACNDQTCFFPKTIDIRLPVEIGGKS